MILELSEETEDTIESSLIDAVEIILNNKEEIVGDIILQNTTKLE